MWADPPRYENSYYGPIDGILNNIFPSTRRFLVKPQAVIRPPLPHVSSIYLPPGSQPHPHASRSSTRIAALSQPAMPAHTYNFSHQSRTSTDSTGDAALPRDAGGWESSLLKPDFLVVKASESTNQDIILALVEVKLSDEYELTHIAQVEEYLNAIQSKPYANQFIAILVMGEKTVVWTTVGQGNDRRQIKLPEYCHTGGLPFCNFMRPLREAYWN